MPGSTLISNHPILVTGGAGFIGSHLVDSLLMQNYTVVSLDNLNDYYNPEIKQLNMHSHRDFENFTFVEGDIRSHELLESIFTRYNFGTVIHLAAMAGVRPSLENPLLYTDVNINGTQQLLETMSRHNVQKFIFASSSSVYGNNEKTPFSEDDSVDYQISHYGGTKKMGEVLCYPYSHLFNIPTTCLRFFTVYGPRQRPEMAIHKFVRKVIRGESLPFFGDGTTSRDYTYVDDIIAGILASMTTDDGFIVYNLGNSEPIKLSELVQIIEEKTGKTANLDKRDIPAGDVLRTYADINRAKHRLDYDPQTHMAEGIGKFVEWYLEKLETHPELYG